MQHEPQEQPDPDFQQDSVKQTAIVDAKRLIANLELPYLIELQGELSKHIALREADNRREAIAQIQRIAQSVGLPLDVILNSAGEERTRKATGPAPLKYENPANPEEKWSGRGRKPHWVQAALNAGKTLADLEIPSA